MERTWTKVGEGEGIARDLVEAEIDALQWQQAEGFRHGMMPVLGIAAAARNLHLPAPTMFAVGGIGPAGLYGIECVYRNGRARVYVLDTGDAITPLASDFWAAA